MIELKTLRKSTHLSQQELADLLRMPVSTYSKWEQGAAVPTESQIYLISLFLYWNGYIKTYLNDPRLTLTEMGLITEKVREDSANRFIDNTKAQLCHSFRNYRLSKEEAESAYQKLLKRYILSRKYPWPDVTEQRLLSETEKLQTDDRCVGIKGFEILPYDAGAIRGTVFDGNEYFFFQRLSEFLQLGNHSIVSRLYQDCHDDFFTRNDLTLSAVAVMNCLFYRYALEFPLAFSAEQLADHYGEEFYSAVEELKKEGHIRLMKSGFYECNTDSGYQYGSRFYLKASQLGQPEANTFKTT